MLFTILQIAVPFVWFGMIGAISFVEAPLKFRAPNITPELGLGIGKIVFRALNRFELAFAMLMTGSLLCAYPPGNFAVYIFGLICILLILQTVWLLPLLNARADRIIAKKNAPQSKEHLIFIGFEALKFLLLLVLGISLLNDNLRLNQ